MNRLTIAGAMILAAALSGCAPQAVKPPGSGEIAAVSPEAAGARKVADALIAALNRGDAAAAADCSRSRASGTRSPRA